MTSFDKLPSGSGDITNDLLDEICRRRGLESDYQLAKHLAIPLQTVRNYRLGKTKPNATTLVQIAEELREDPMRVMAKVKMEAARTNREREVWRPYAGRLLLVAFSIALGGLAQESEAVTRFAQNGVKIVDQNIHYARKLIRNLRETFQLWMTDLVKGLGLWGGRLASR